MLFLIDFRDVLPEISEAITNASFLSVDAEFTGLYHYLPRQRCRGYRNGAVGVCVCVRLLALSRLNRLTYGHKIWYRD